MVGFNTAEVCRKLPEPNTDMDPKPSSSKQGKMNETPYELSLPFHQYPIFISLIQCPFDLTLLSFQVLKTAMTVRKPLQRNLSKKASEKAVNPTRQPKKATGPTLFSSYHRLDETLNQNQNNAEQNQEAVQKQVLCSNTPPSEDLASQ
ncbi:hypothetical protein J1605_018833 [Eschrichtius robustus]|uniref:Uncharacterized protein n=1 Tax=Eschrichtius robustus TaxID=9764 RepID=A0AB34HUQ9_ESCRO|nr:hypothetical protein J1605_018833 [Eschrichtius robustus]